MKSFTNEEMLYGWKRDKKSVLAVFFLTLLGILCIGMVLVLNMQTTKQVGEYNEMYEEYQHYTILDNFIEEAEYEIEGTAGATRLKIFLRQLEKSEYFKYYMMYDQSVYFADYVGNDENIYEYEYNSNLQKQVREIEGKDGQFRTYTNVEGFWIGNNVIEDFNLKINEGEGFSTEDFTLTSEDNIEVILGANYAKDYKVGDDIYINFIFAEREAKVVGILEEGTNIYYRGEFKNLDTSVIMPIFENDYHNGRYLYTIDNYYYTIRNSGVVATKLSSEDVQQIIEEYSKNAGFETSYYVSEYMDVEKETFTLGMENTKLLLDILAMLIAVTTLVLLTIFYINKIQKNSRYYAILLMNGSNKKEMFQIIVREMIVILSVAYIIAGIVLMNVAIVNMVDEIKVLMVLFLGTMVFGSIPIAFTGIAFWKRDLVFYLKEEI